MPWGGVDLIVTSAQIIMGLQTVVSRQSDLTQVPAITGAEDFSVYQQEVPGLFFFLGGHGSPTPD